MLDLKNKCLIDEYDIEINSDLRYEEGFGLIQKIFDCIEIDTEIPQGQLSILFTDWTYAFPISKSDNLRIANLLKKLGFDKQYVQSIYELNTCY